jgi:membrane-bound serine protease (ClpP class)
VLARVAHLSPLAQLSPNAALLVLTAGIALIYVELNRPGWVVPGAVGLTAALCAVASLGRAGVNPWAVVLVGTAVALLGLGLRRRMPVVVDVTATLALVLGFLYLVRDAGIRSGIAAGCGILLGGSTSILTRIARRARSNKGLD